jgi:hypothetical protein
MQRRLSSKVGVLVAAAVACGLAGCAGSGERLPQCSGKAVPINAAGAAVPSGAASLKQSAEVSRGA